MLNSKIAPLNSRERIIIFTLCILGACRIFLFSAAFPFFNNVDEQAHFDMVYKYSKGHIPRAALEGYDHEASELIVLYGTLEYLIPLEQFPQDLVWPPMRTNLTAKQSKIFVEKVARKEQQKNPQTWSFPVYYTVAGLWCFIGRFLGIQEGYLLYWIRFLNVPLFTALVWFSHVLARTFFPQSFTSRISLPLLVTFFPQDTFYAITNDALSPLLFAIALFMLLQIFFNDKSHTYNLFTGLVVAATFLTKISNVAVLVLLTIIILLKTRYFLINKHLKYIHPLITLVTASTVPISIWLVRNYIVSGSLTGSAETIKNLGWTIKPFWQMWNHPIFTPSGFLFFITELTKTFWGGELVWHLKQLASPGVDIFYVVSTAAFVLVSGFGTALNKPQKDTEYRFAISMSFCVLVVSVLFLAALSIRHDFGNCWTPSRQQPYFTSGRLVSGAILPFLLIYLDGLNRIFPRFKNQLLPFITVGLIVIIITWSELWLTWGVFKSPFNWFHLK